MSRITFVAVAAVFALLQNDAYCATTIRVAAKSGDAAGGSGVLATFSIPQISASGDVVFVSEIADVLHGPLIGRGVYTSRGLPRQLARSGQIPPVGTGTYNTFGPPVAIGPSQAAFDAIFVDPSFDSGLFHFDGEVTRQVARRNAPLPDGNGFFSSYNAEALAVNNVGDLAFHAKDFIGTVGGVTENEAVYRSNAGVVTKMLRRGDAAPGGGRWGQFYHLSLNDQKQIAFYGATFGTGAQAGLFRSDGINSTRMVAQGQAVPVGSGTFNSFPLRPELNNLGAVAFAANLAGSGVTSQNNQGIYLANGSTIKEVARRGQPAPGTNATFADFGFQTRNIALSDRGTVAFRAQLSSNAGSGIFEFDGTSTRFIVVSGQTIPGGVGEFYGIDRFATNALDQVVFLATIQNIPGTFATPNGLFLADPQLGLVSIIREGDPFLGSTISTLSFIAGTGAPTSSELTGLNDNGELAFRFTLSNGISGVAVATVPEPHLAQFSVLLCFAAPTILRRFRSRATVLAMKSSFRLFTPPSAYPRNAQTPARPAPPAAHQTSSATCRFPIQSARCAPASHSIADQFCI